MTWQATNNHKIQAMYTEDPANLPVCYGQSFFGGPCYDGFNVDFQEQGNIWQANWNATWTPTLLSTVKVGHFKNHFAISPLQSTVPRQDLIDALDVPGGNLGAGVDPAPFIDLLDTGATFDATIFGPEPEDRLRDQVEASVTKFLETSFGQHSLKGGIDLQRTSQEGSSIIAGNALAFGTFASPVAGLGGTADPTTSTTGSTTISSTTSPVGRGRAGESADRPVRAGRLDAQRAFGFQPWTALRQVRERERHRREGDRRFRVRTASGCFL
jgi:hypothetical protein